MATLITFDTTNAALWAEEIAGARGVPCELVPAPPGAAARCNLALLTPSDHLAAMQTALRDEGVPFHLFTPG